jgi:tetratricopeptide (TPR) repeat protein
MVVNYHFNGLNVFGYHVFNLAVHLGTAILVWWLTLLTLSTPAMKDDKITRHAGLIALFTGLVFVSHPVQTEAVTYIWQRASSMAALFYLASLCLYVKSRFAAPNSASRNDTMQKIYYCGSLLTAVLAMFTKENTVTLPLMILFYEISFFKTKRNLNWPYLFPFLLTLFIIPLTILFTKAQQFQAIQRFVHGPGGISSWQYLLTQFRVIVTYIRLVFLPLNLNLDYDFPISKSIFEWPTLFSFLFLAGILFLAKRLYSKYRLVSFSIFWFFLTLSLESSMFPLRNVIFEHRLYLPLAGYSMFLVSGAYYLRSFTQFTPECFNRGFRMTIGILTIIVILNSILTYQRNKVWKDEITLWSDAVRKSPYKARPVNDLGFAYYKQSNFAQAIADYNKAITLKPDLADAYVGRGLSYADVGNFVQAIADYNKAIKIEPTFGQAYNNRGIFYLHQGKPDRAISDLTRAIDLYPLDAKAYYNRGLSYAKQGNVRQAIADYKKAIEIDNSYADAYYNLGLIYAHQGSFTEAVNDFNKTIEIDPDYADAYNNRGIVYGIQGNFNQALSSFTQAIKINPDDADAYYNRGNVYYQQNNFIKAKLDYNKAAALKK